jgi:flagellin-like hook-associated protein FlgL
MGELSATMVRMEMVRNHDEEYVMALDKQIAKDIEVDISEAIMRLTQVSTSYQAAMQVGAQLLNSSLLNYL